MKQCVRKPISLSLFSVLLFTSTGCNRQAATTGSTMVTPPDAAPAIAPVRGNENTMVVARFLEDRVKSDADDIVALNKLSGCYLQLHRETEDVSYLELALRSAGDSLRVLPADQNLGGLRALAQAEFETHNFTSARDHARDLTEYEPRRSFGFQLLGDALLELGDYDGATTAYAQMEQLDFGTTATESRLAHLALLRGDSDTARRRYTIALNRATRSSFPSPETIAWCHWRRGEVDMASGDYQKAERHYREALKVLPDYPHALTSLARLRAGQGDLPGAIERLENVIRKHADPVDQATLGDLYKLAGREFDAAQQYTAVEHLSRLSTLHSALYNRHLVLFWADHDLNRDQAYALARKEYETRRDVYGADALAWAALKAGKLNEAQAAIKEALRLGTQDARLFYHAGMIAHANGDRITAIDFLRRALKLNPHFDPWHSKVATKVLQEASEIAAVH